MKIGFLITARLKSSRLKMKILLPLNKRRVIDRVIDRSKMVCDGADVVLCTSTVSQDDALIEVAIEQKINSYRGDPEDVLSRLNSACEKHGFDYVVGMTADNPFFSIDHANRIKELFISDPNLDFVFTSGMPIGANVYGMNAKALRTICAVKKEIDTEIWGKLINRPDIFNVLEIKAEPEYRFDNLRMTLDEELDYKFFENLYQEYDSNDTPDLLGALNLLRSRPDIANINSSVEQKDLSPQKKSEIDNFFIENRSHILEIKNKIYSSV